VPLRGIVDPTDDPLGAEPLSGDPLGDEPPAVGRGVDSWGKGLISSLGSYGFALVKPQRRSRIANAGASFSFPSRETNLVACLASLDRTNKMVTVDSAEARK